MIARVALIGAAAAILGACGGGESRGGGGSDEPAMVQQGTYVYDTNKRHAQVSLSGADLSGMVIR